MSLTVLFGGGQVADSGAGAADERQQWDRKHSLFGINTMDTCFL